MNDCPGCGVNAGSGSDDQRKTCDCGARLVRENGSWRALI